MEAQSAWRKRGAANLETDEDFEAMCQSRLHESTAALEQTVQRLDPAALRRAADLLDQSKRVCCMGQGSSMVLAEEAWSLFATLSPKYVLVPDSHQQMAALALMEEGDTALYFSYSGSTRELLDAIEVAHLRKGKVILITRFPKSPGGQRADVVLQCGSNEGPLQAGSATARIAQLFVLDLLYTELFQRAPEQAVERRARIAEAIARRHL